MNVTYDTGINFLYTANSNLYPVTMAIAWFKQFDFVASTIVGATSAGQLDTTLATLDLLLPDEVLQACDKVHQDIPYPVG